MIHFELNYQELDPEAKFGLVPKKFTAVSTLWTFFLGLIFTGVFYGCLYPLHIQHKYQMVDMFFHGGMENRSTIPYYTMFLTCWCLAFLFVKWRKLKVQRKALSINLTPMDSRFVITRQIASPLVNQLHKRVFQSEKFMLFWRIERTLNCLDNIGHVSDVSAMMNDLAENDANWVESSYTLTKGLIWAIPVLGFIGTVLGLSQAVGGFGAVISRGADLETLKNALGGVTSGLGTAFETTLIALIAALVVQLLMTLMMRKEEEFLDECISYCYAHVTSKLKIFADDEEDNLSSISEQLLNERLPDQSAGEGSDK
ncbi:MAG: MotA/TolQ/ExbB proton channel family protein [Lentisphaeria bacterium]|nr:MotA/TolQ/ExbB proton channel family protein [Lentisphaeria bacterium]